MRSEEADLCQERGPSVSRVAPQLEISQRQERILKSRVRAHKTPQQISVGMQIILGASKDQENTEIAGRLNVDAQRVARWRKRWTEAQARLSEAERQDATDGDLEDMIVELLSDEYRSGAPSKFSAEQFTQIIALACEDPQESGYPVTHWTPKEIATEAIRRKIVDSISIRHVDRFLKGGGSAAPQVALLDDLQGQARRPRNISAKR